MATEDLTGTDKFVDDLVATNPVATDSVSDGDEHIRGVKNVLKNTLPNVTAAVTATAAQLNKTASTFTGADGSAAGASGMVTAPVATDNTKFLKGDGTWATPAGGGSSTTAGIIWDNHSTSTAYDYDNDGTEATTSATAATDITVVDDKTLLLTHAADAGELRSVYIEKKVNVAGGVISSHKTKKIIISAEAVGTNNSTGFGKLRLFSDSNYTNSSITLGTRTDSGSGNSSETSYSGGATISATNSHISYPPGNAIDPTLGATDYSTDGYWFCQVTSADVTIIFDNPIDINSFTVVTTPDTTYWNGRQSDLSLVFYNDSSTAIVTVTADHTTTAVEDVSVQLGLTSVTASTYWQLESFDDWDVQFASSTTTKLINKTAADAVIRARITAPTASTGGGGSGGTITAVAAGAIANGDKVILRSDGKVATVASTTGISTPITAGSEVTFESYTLFGTAVAYNPNLADQIVVAYMDRSNSDYGTVRLGTITGTTPAFESEVVFNAASTSEWIHIAFDPNTTGKFVVVYEDVGDSNKLKAVVGSIASTTVTFGSEYTLDSTGAVSWPSCEFDPNTAGKFLVAYSDEGSSSYGRVLVSTINYTTGVITPGSPYTFKSSSTTYIGAAFDPNTAGKFVVGYESGNDGYTIVGTITTGTTVTFGSEVAFSTAAAWVVDIGVDFDPDTAGKFMVSYREDGPGTGTDPLSKVLIGTVTGTVPSYGSSNSVWTGDTWGLVAEFIGSNKIIIAFRTDGPPTGQGVINLGTVSGTTVTMGTVQTFNAGNTGGLDIASDPNTSGKFITSYTDQGDNGYGKTVVGQLSTSTSTNLTADNFIGISDGAYADAATATIQVIGATDDAQSGMTIGSNYYVQTDGTLATTADSPSVSVGVALSATEILIKS
jgi:hypothetical protein